MTVVMGSTIQRQRLLVQGIVQGVGFRPFIYSQARRLGLAGFVRNDSQGVTLEVEGSDEALANFQRALNEELPPLARITSLVVEPVEPTHEEGFAILQSERQIERSALISPDTATCAECLHELFDPDDRRAHYPFINCTNCGPRFTIVQDIPYDRAMTTMRAFPLCPTCQAEYDDPGDRRFHAQPNACPVCGPQVSLFTWDDMGEVQPVALASSEVLREAARLLADGAILAIKGLGGYHLACDALDEEAVHHLRQRKHREAKPFALMARDLATVRQLCQVNDDEAALLQSYRRPIVLLAQQPACHVAPDVAPVSKTLGMMLPYTPLHHVLLQHFAEIIPAERPAVLVMTSGNLSDEPIAYRDDDAALRLQTIAEGMVMHNRAIHMRCDDSVVRVVAGSEQIFRRARGYAPEPLQLAFDLPIPVLACGGHLKNTFCLGKGRSAFLSHHIGDMENLATLASFRAGITHFQRLFDIAPEAIVHDLHPEYLATRYALDSAFALKIGVQHHHAHIASVLAEHGLRGPVIGVAADGTGFGSDGAIWGCEILAADLCSFERLAHLTYVPLPGGEQAVRQPWRMAATYLAQTYGKAFLDLDLPFVQQLDRATWRTLAQMSEQGINSPLTSSLGRLFDAVAALLGVRSEIVYEGQAAIELEALAQSVREAGLGRRECYPFHIGEQTPALLDVTPIMRGIVEDLQHRVPVAAIAWRFHRTLAGLLACACLAARQQTGLKQVALSGGVFQNRLLLEQLCERLNELDFEVFINRRVPPNDGGLSFGQLAVAAARLRRG
jgi:hydrogenase maturation protein HypF